MENSRGLRYCKFFRGLIASRLPDKIVTLVESYNKIRREMEGNYLDIVIRSEGAFSYQDIMTMPLDSIQLLVERMNTRAEDMNKARSGR